jgi:hypothetical protein
MANTIKRGDVLMGEEVTVWYDEEGDYLKVLFAQKKGYFRETDNDAVMEKVDEAGYHWLLHSQGQCLKRPNTPCRHAQEIARLTRAYSETLTYLATVCRPPASAGAPVGSMW